MTRSAAPAAKGSYERNYDATRFTDIGSLRTRVNDKGEEKLYIVLDSDIEIFANGQKVEVGQYRTVNLLDPRVGLETAFSNGKMDEETYNARLQTIEDKKIEYKLTVPPQNGN